MAKILIADDERDIRELVAFTLNLAGHEVTAASNGEEAYRRAEEIIPDLIVLDVRMPRMTGYEACEKIKANHTTQHIPVVFLSAKGQESEVQAGFNAGAIEYITKPFSLEDLAVRIQQILNNNGLH